jgi:Arc/MetJ-type ribon-helix-helix transcriptional regulator
MRPGTKRKVSVTLDEDLVKEVEKGNGSLSAVVNTALRSDLERRRRQLALERLLDRLAAEDGPSAPRTSQKLLASCAFSEARTTTSTHEARP